MAWSNITIPNRFSSTDQFIRRLEEQDFKIKQLERKLDEYDKEFYNLFNAAKLYGRIEVTKDKETIVLILDPPANKETTNDQ